jgi:nitrogen-specific signal transduction histidine kinase
VRSEGVGLGLHVVRLIAEAHGGAVSVDSTTQATRFRIELPRYSQGAVLADESLASGG